jgi:hypothetical protein
MANELVTRDSGHASIDLISGDNYERVERVATGLAASGMFKDVTTTQQAMAKILLGADMGLTPTQSLMSIDVVRGNVQIRGKRLLAWIKSSPRYDVEVVERTPERGALQFWEKSKRTGEWAKVGPLKDPEKPPGPDNPPGPIVFTLEQAKAKGLWAKGGGWDNWPENMCLWRCASIGYNLFCSDLGGGISVYTEADSFTDSTATEIGQGEGDGSEPGWHGMSGELVTELESLLSTAETFGWPLDRATVQMRCNGQPAETVLAFVSDTLEMLAKQKEGGES